MYKLTAIGIKSLPSGKHEDGGGLRIVVSKSGRGKWVYRYTCYGQRREMGLGQHPAVSLKQAREAAADARAIIAQDIDPITERSKRRTAALSNRCLLSDVVQETFESRKTELKGDGKAGRWLSPIQLHVLPKLGKRPIAQITQGDIRDTLAPIWHAKADTARKALNRLRLVYRHAAALGLDVDLQAPDKAKALLGAQNHVAKHIPSIAWPDVPDFYAGLNQNTPTHLALRLTILTGLRSFPIRNAHLDEFDGDVWTVPGVKMKGRRGKEVNFRMPLSREAQHVIYLARPLARDGFLFAPTRKGVISDMTLSQYMKRQGFEARPHGFRASLRNWLAECTDAPHEVAEAMLAHTADSQIVRAYRRTDFLEQRAALTERWAEHCIGQSGAVVKLPLRTG